MTFLLVRWCQMAKLGKRRVNVKKFGGLNTARSH